MYMYILLQISGLTSVSSIINQNVGEQSVGVKQIRKSLVDR